MHLVNIKRNSQTSEGYPLQSKKIKITISYSNDYWDIDQNSFADISLIHNIHKDDTYQQIDNITQNNQNAGLHLIDTFPALQIKQVPTDLANKCWVRCQEIFPQILNSECQIQQCKIIINFLANKQKESLIIKNSSEQIHSLTLICSALAVVNQDPVAKIIIITRTSVQVNSLKIKLNKIKCILNIQQNESQQDKEIVSAEQFERIYFVTQNTFLEQPAYELLKLQNMNNNLIFMFDETNDLQVMTESQSHQKEKSYQINLLNSTFQILSSFLPSENDQEINQIDKKNCIETVQRQVKIEMDFLEKYLRNSLNNDDTGYQTDNQDIIYCIFEIFLNTIKQQKNKKKFSLDFEEFKHLINDKQLLENTINQIEQIFLFKQRFNIFGQLNAQIEEMIINILTVFKQLRENQLRNFLSIYLNPKCGCLQEMKKIILSYYQKQELVQWNQLEVFGLPRCDHLIKYAEQFLLDYAEKVNSNKLGTITIIRLNTIFKFFSQLCFQLIKTNRKENQQFSKNQEEITSLSSIFQMIMKDMKVNSFLFFSEQISTNQLLIIQNQIGLRINQFQYQTQIQKIWIKEEDAISKEDLEADQNKRITSKSEFIKNCHMIVEEREAQVEKRNTNKSPEEIISTEMRNAILKLTDPTNDKTKKQKMLYQIKALEELFEEYNIKELSNQFVRERTTQHLDRFKYRKGIQVFRQLLCCTSLKPKVIEQIWNLEPGRITKVRHIYQKTLKKMKNFKQINFDIHSEQYSEEISQKTVITIDD